jgi:hypothetical protein
MGVHREEGRFVVRLELSAEFDEDYEGDDDGYAWLARWRSQVQGRLARAIFDVLRADPAFDAIPASRGGNPDEELEIRVRFKKGAKTDESGGASG